MTGAITQVRGWGMMVGRAYGPFAHSLGDGRLEFTIPNNRAEFTVPKSQFAFTVPDSRNEFTVTEPS